MHLDRSIICMYRRTAGLSTRPDHPNTLTDQFYSTNDAPREPFTSLLHVILPGHIPICYVYVYSLGISVVVSVITRTPPRQETAH